VVGKSEDPGSISCSMSSKSSLVVEGSQNLRFCASDTGCIAEIAWTWPV